MYTVVVPPDLPNKGQIRVEREKVRKQSYMGQYLIGGNSSKVTSKKASEATTVPAIGLGPSTCNTHNKKRIATGDLRHKASKTLISPSKDIHEDVNKRSDKLEVTEVDRLIQEDQAQLAISNISGQVREAIARKREEAIQKKKSRDEARQVECENHKKQKSTQSEIMPAGEKTKKRNIGETEEAEYEVLRKRGKLNGRKRSIVEGEEAAQVESSKR